MNFRLLLIISGTLSVFSLGCGGGRPSLQPVAGVVTLNGEPVAGAQIGFEPQDIPDYQRPSMATTDAQGGFTVGTYGQSDGIPVGTYRVTVTKTEVVGKIPDDYNSEEPAANARPVRTMAIVPLLYSDAESSGLTVTVTSDGMTPDIIALEGQPEPMTTGGRADEP